MSEGEKKWWIWLGGREGWGWERGRGRERHLKREDSSHVITDSAPQPACTQIYYFTRAWKTQQIKVWSVRSPKMDIFILDFGFSFLKSAFEILSHRMVKLEYIWTCNWVFPLLNGSRVVAVIQGIVNSLPLTRCCFVLLMVDLWINVITNIWFVIQHTKWIRNCPYTMIIVKIYIMDECSTLLCSAEGGCTWCVPFMFQGSHLETLTSCGL